jgi:hypothetical protein
MLVVEAAGVAAGCVAVAGPGFRRKGTAGTRTLVVDGTIGIADINRLDQRSRHPAARLRIKLMMEE